MRASLLSLSLQPLQLLVPSMVVLLLNNNVKASLALSLGRNNSAVRLLRNIHMARHSLPSSCSPSSSSSFSPSQLNMNFFKDLIDSAFENDPNLSSNKSQQQIDGPNDDGNDFNIFTSSNNEKTEVQKRWLESQSKTPPASSSSSPTFSSPAADSSRTNAKGAGAPINPSLLHGTKWTISFYLTGIPDFDPSNSLYGSKVNISTRKDSSMARDGFAIGADMLPAEPSSTCTLQLLEGGIAKVSDSAFTSEAEAESSPSTETLSESSNLSESGKWIISDDNRMIRFSFDCKGYQRTVTTTGTLQNVSWTDGDEVKRKSSATYSIPVGVVFAEASIGYGSTPGMLTMAENNGNGGLGSGKNDPGGLLKVEKKTGVWGLSSKMVSCGKFSAQMVLQE